MRQLVLLVAAAWLAVQSTTVPVTLAWDLDPTHDTATFEAEIDGAVTACGSVQVLATERRCTVPAVARGTRTFRLRGIIGTEIGPWSAEATGVVDRPGVFSIRASHELPPDPIGPPSVAATSIGSSGANPAVVGVPTATAGDLVVVIVAAGQPVSYTFPTGWTELYDRVSGTASQAAAWRVAAAGDPSFIAVSLSGPSATSYNVYRITGQRTNPPEAATAVGTSATPNPPNLSPSWGAVPTLWIASMAHDGSNSATVPTNYTNPVVQPGDPTCASAQRTASVASENPAAFTASRSDDWVAAIIAVR